MHANTNRETRLINEAIANVCTDIFKFAKACNVRLEYYQIEICKAIMQGARKIAIKSGRGPGKTFFGAFIMLWRTLRCPNNLGVYSAPSAQQIRTIAFGEMRQLIDRMQPWLRRHFTCQEEKIIINNGRDWKVIGKPAKTAESASGLHRQGLTIILEEATGIPDDVILAFEKTLTNADHLMIKISNPNRRSGDFFECFEGRKAKNWKQFTFNSEEIAQRCPYRIRPESVRETLEEYGRDSDVYRISVLGEFPLEDPENIIPSALLREAQHEQNKIVAMREPSIITGTRLKTFGIDYARQGKDFCSMFQREGYAILNHWNKAKVFDPHEANRQAYMLQEQYNWNDSDCYYIADAGGMGQGVIPRLYQDGKQVFEFHNNGRAVDPKMYANKLTEGFFHLAKLLKRDPRKVYIPDVDRLFNELTNRNYYFNKKDQIIAETKDQYKSRGFDSPDLGDGCVMAMYDHGAMQMKASTKNYRRR